MSLRTASLWFLGALLLLATCRTMCRPNLYATQERDNIAAGTSAGHVVGTDELGRDRAARISLAILLSLGGACCASAVSSTVALALGGLSAFSPRWVSWSLLYIADLFLVLPWLFLLMLVRSTLPLNLPPAQSEVVTFLLLALLGVPVFLRVNHQTTASLIRADWMLQAQAWGLKPHQIAWQVWPHLRPLLWTQFLLYVPACVIAEANLGTMGLGLSEPLPSLGTFLANLQSEALLGTTYLVFLPVALLILALVALELTIFGAEP